MLDNIKTKEEIELEKQKRLEKISRKTQKQQLAKLKEHLRIEIYLFVGALFVALMSLIIFGANALFKSYWQVKGVNIVFAIISGVGAILPIILWAFATFGSKIGRDKKNSKAIAMYIVGGALSSFALGIFSSIYIWDWTAGTDFTELTKTYYLPIALVAINVLMGVIYILFNKVGKLSSFKSLMFSGIISDGAVTLTLLSVFLAFMSKNSWKFNGVNALLLITTILSFLSIFLVFFVVKKTTPSTNSGIVRAATHQMCIVGAMFCTLGVMAIAIGGIIITSIFVAIGSLGSVGGDGGGRVVTGTKIGDTFYGTIY